MPQPRSRWVLLALPLLLAGSTWTDGKALIDQGAYVEACQHWATALATDPGDSGARKGMRKYGELAWRQGLDRARELEADGKYPEAIAAFEAVMALERVLGSYNLARFEFDPEETRAERDDTTGKLLAESYEKGLAAAQIAQYATALEKFEIARGIDPMYLDLPQQLGKVHRALADEALAGARYDEAVREYRAAYDFTHDTSHLAWGSAVLAAQGRYYLREGGCRQAVEAFETALPYAINEPRLDGDLATAQACAQLDFVVEPFELTPGLVVPPGYDLGALASDKLSEQLVTQGTRFVRLIAPGSSEATTGRRFEVYGRIARLEVNRPAAAASRQQATATLRDLCLGEGGYYSSHEEYCDEDVTVSWEQWEQHVEMKISGSIKLIEPGSGRQVLTRTHDASAVTTAIQVRDFQRVAGDHWITTAVAAEPTQGAVALPAELLALQAEPAPLPSDADMVSAAAENFAAEAAKAILAAVDGETVVQPPRVLANIRRPVIDPSDIDISPGDVIREPAHVEVPVPAAPPAPTPPPAPAP